MRSVFGLVGVLFISGLLAAGSAGCGLEIEHDAAFDPNTPPEKQAKSMLSGVVKLEGESDHTGVDVELQNDSRTYTVATDEKGEFTVSGVVPGEYLMTVSTRYFQPVSQVVRVPIGRKVALGNFPLSAKRAALSGTAIAQRLYNRQLLEEGGVVVSIDKVESIRGGAAKAPAAGLAAADSIEFPNNSTISDNEGGFTIVGVPPGKYVIVASSPGVSTLEVGEVTVTGEKDVALDAIVLQAVTGYFDIVGLADGAPSSLYTNAPQVTLQLTGFNADSMRIGQSASGKAEDCAFQPDEPWQVSITHDLLYEGANTICVQYLSDDGRQSGVITGDIVLDTLAPDPSTLGITINKGDAYTDSNIVTLSFAAFDPNTGVKTILLSESPAFTTTTTATYNFVPKLPYSLLSAGAHEVYVKFGDKAGNYSSAISTFVIVDADVPSVTGFSVMNGYGEFVSAANPSRTSQVVVNLDVVDASPIEVMISDRNDFAGASWIPYRPQLIWNFVPPTQPDGKLETLYLKVRDAAGHVVAVPPFQVRIDTIAPTGLNLQLVGNGVISQYAYSTQATITVNLTFPVNDTVRIDVSEDGAFNSFVSFSARPTTTFTLSPLDGSKTVYARFIDLAGNVSPTISNQIVFDTLPPQLASVTLPDGLYTNQSSVRLNTSAADAYQMQVTEGTGCGGNWVAYQPVVIHDFYTSAEELKTIAVRYRDGAGNQTGCFTNGVQYDKTPPSTLALEAVDSNFATITRTNVLRYYIHLRVTDASPVTLQYNDIIYWSGVNKEEALLGQDSYRPWDVRSPAPATQDTRTTYVRMVDAAGNEATVGPINVTIQLLVASMQIPAVTPNRPISVLIGTSNATQLWLSEDQFFNTGTSTYSLNGTTAVNFTLSTGDGVKTVFGRFFAADGSFVDISAQTRLDQNAPYVPDPTYAYVNINGNAATTNLATGAVTLSLRAEDPGSGLKSMKVANLRPTVPADTCASRLAAAPVENYVASFPWTLAGATTDVEGYRYVCAQFADQVNNWSTPVSDAIYFDTKFPTAAANPILINGGNQFTNDRFGLVSLSLDAAGATRMRFANDLNGYFYGWETYNPDRAWYIYRQQGTHWVSVQFSDDAGNLIGPYHAAITLDTFAPAGFPVQINAGAAVTNQTTVDVSMLASGADYVELSSDPSFALAVSAPYGTVYTGWTLASGAGNKTVYVRYRDWAGNQSGVYVDGILYDPDAPVNGLVSLDGGAAATNAFDGTVSVAVSASDALTYVKDMRVIEKPAAQSCAEALAGAATVPYSTAAFSLQLTPNGDVNIEETRYVCAVFADQIGNWSAPVSDAIFFDLKLPVVAGAGLAINGGAQVTNSTAVWLDFMQTGAAEVQLTNDMGAPSAWLSLTSPMAWTIDGGDGPHTVWVAFKDAAGNATGLYSAVITLDTQAPLAGALSIPGSPGYVKTTTVDLAMSALGADYMEISNDGLFDNPANRFAYATSYAGWPLSPGEGAKVIWIRYLDEAGNASAPVSTAVVYDITPPQPVAVSLNGGRAVTNSTSLVAALSAPDAVSMTVAFAPGLASCGGPGAYEAFAGVKNFAMGADGDYTVSAYFKDAAQNESVCAAASIRLDTTLVAPGFAAAFTGATVVAGRTRFSPNTLYLSNLGTDATEMIVALNPSFAGASWEPVAAAKSLPIAEGANTAYVKLRDAGGNQSVAAVTAGVFLDTLVTTPAVRFADNGSDGFAVSTTQIELRWDGVAPDADIAGYTLERQFDGGAWTAIKAVICTTPCNAPANISHTDTVQQLGKTHAYRLRASDTLGNLSAWSPVITTVPQGAVERMHFIEATNLTRYDFAPAAVTYAFDGFGDTYLGAMALYYRPNYSDPRWNEQFKLRTYDAAANFVYQATFSTGKAWFGTLDAGGTTGSWPSVALDNLGNVHIAYYSNSPAAGLYYRTNASGAWVELPIETGAGVGMFGSVAVDKRGVPHFSYYDAVNERLRYATWNSIANNYVAETVLSASGGLFRGQYTATQVDRNDKVYIAYVFQKTAVTDAVGYVTGSTLAWNAALEAATTGTRTAGQHLTVSLRVTETTAHLAYYYAETGELRYVTKPRISGGFSAPAVLDAALDEGMYNALDVGPDGAVHVAYLEKDSASLRYLKRSGGAWAAPEVIPTSDPVDGQIKLAVDEAGAVRISVGGPSGLSLIRSVGNSWAETIVDPAAGAGLFSALAADRGGKVHLAYAGPVSGALRYGAVDTYGWAQLPVASTVEASSMVLDIYGRRHVVYRVTGGDLYYASDIEGLRRTYLVDTGTAGRPMLTVDAAATVRVAYLLASGNNSYYRAKTLANAAFQTRVQVTNDTPALTATPILRDSGGNRIVFYTRGNGKLMYAYRGSADAAFTDDIKPYGGTGDIYGTHPAAVVDASDNRYVTYANGGFLKHVRRVGGAWSSAETIIDNAQTDVGKYSSLALDAANKLHVAYADVNGHNLKYATDKSGAWVNEVVDNVGAGDVLSTSIVVDADDAVHVTYYSTAHGLRYATNATGAWVIETLAAGSGVGTSSNVVADAGGRLLLSYLTGAAGDLVMGYDFSGWLYPSSTVQLK